jgi:hypothetical protein
MTVAPQVAYTKTETSANNTTLHVSRCRDMWRFIALILIYTHEPPDCYMNHDVDR